MDKKIKILEQAIELFNKHKEPLFINGILICNYDGDGFKRELYFADGKIHCWVDDKLVFTIKFELIRTIETRRDILYREDETLLW